MILFDTHTHTSFSSDSDTPAAAMLDRAAELGLKGITITDHMDYMFPVTERAGYNFEFKPDEYFTTLVKLKADYADRLDVRIGIELGLRNEEDVTANVNKMYSELIQKYPFDYVIGSTHCLEYTDPYYPDYWEDKSAVKGISGYYNAVLSNIRSFTDADSLGHLDYLVRYVPKAFAYEYRPLDFSDVIDEILEFIINNNIALEVNSAGIKYGLGFAHPHPLIIQRYRELGGELLTIGSDAHKPEHIAFDFNTVSDCLKSFGFKYYMVYKERKAETLLL